MLKFSEFPLQPCSAPQQSAEVSAAVSPCANGSESTVGGVVCSPWAAGAPAAAGTVAAGCVRCVCSSVCVCFSVHAGVVLALIFWVCVLR